MVSKSKLFVLLVFGIAVLAAGVLAATLSEDIFPQSLNGIPLASLVQEQPDKDLVEGFSAYYASDEMYQEIGVLLWRFKDEARAKQIEESFIPDIKSELNIIFGKVDWSIPEKVSVGDYQATAITYRGYLEGYDEDYIDYIDGGFIFLAVREYFILVQMVDYTGVPSLSTLKSVLGTFVNKIPETEIKGCTDSGAVNYNPKATIDDESCTYKGSDDAVCKDDDCEFWLGENCKNCVQDCQISGFCCLAGYSYIYGRDYHNKNYNIRDALAGLIPRGAILIPKGVIEDDLPLAVPQVCDTEAVNGECAYNYDCSSGVCVDNWCVKTYSEEFQEIKNEQMIEKLYNDQTSYKKEYEDAYKKARDFMTNEKRIRKVDLKVSLEVQGNTAGKIPEVSKGDEVEVRLEIENNSKDDLTLSAEIFYPGYEAGVFELEEKKYILTLESEHGFSSFIGSFETEPESIEVPEDSTLYIYSKVIPQQTGYLDVQGLIYYGDKESEVSNYILVKERPCDWWPICL